MLSNGWLYLTLLLPAYHCRQWKSWCHVLSMFCFTLILSRTVLWTVLLWKPEMILLFRCLNYLATMNLLSYVQTSEMNTRLNWIYWSILHPLWLKLLFSYTSCVFFYIYVKWFSCFPFYSIHCNLVYFNLSFLYCIFLLSSWRIKVYIMCLHLPDV